MLDNTSIVTPTRRLSRHLRFKYASEQIQQGKQAWQTPDYLPWSSWCQRLYEYVSLRTGEQWLLLSDAQQGWIWQDIINRSSYRDQLLQVNATAKQALQAYHLCKQWGIPVFPEGVFLSEDAQAFSSWVNSYEQLKLKNKWLDEATLPDYLSRHISLIPAETRVQLQGFDQFTSQQQTFIDSLRERGIEVVQAAFEKINQHVSVYAANDMQSEIRAAACWAREQLLVNPDAKIGIVTPRLRHKRELIIRTLTSVLSPNSVIKPMEQGEMAWSVALGKPLTDYPMIDVAVELLALGRRKVAIQNLSKLLHARFIKGHEIEWSQRALFDAALRQSGIEQLTLRSVSWFAEQRCDEFAHCAQFIQLLKDFEISFLSHARMQTLRQWAIHFSEWLTNFGWPGHYGLNSVEHQTLLAWQDCLSQLGGLDPTGNKVSYHSAFSQLTRLLADSQFQPETPETSIQVSAPGGSAGMQFDYLWILDMQDDSWPEQTVPNAFIPRRCQVDYGVPAATAERRLQQASLMLENLLLSAQHTVLSYALQEGDRACRPSPLIAAWIDKGAFKDIVDIEAPQSLIFASGQLETFFDTAAPPIPSGKLARGGSSLFRDQSLCPFRAFARHRLHASSLPLTDIGLSAAERGNLTHLALQYLWQRVGDHNRLVYLADSERYKLIESVVSEAIKQHAALQPETFTERFTMLEQRRLEQLLEQWLSIERERSPFKVIATEEWQTVRFQDLELHLRIDRVDELADGRCVIIDYKTGQVRKSDWESDNPNDPQLPLYAVTANSEIAAVAFASLKPGKLGFKGEVDSDDIFPAVKQDEAHSWSERMEEWRRVLERLANDFRQGKATVEPLVTACRYCDLHSLCRIYERTGTLDAELLTEDDVND